MSKKINFFYNGQSFCLVCQEEEKTMELAFKKFISETGKDIKELFFLCNGDLVNPEKPIKELKEEKGIIQILVFDFEKEDEEEIIKQSKELICPICREICMINFKDYKITFSNCKNGQTCSNILFNEFNDFQKINESTIKCKSCNTNKNETTDNKFFKCCKCNINLCPLCKIAHEKKVNNNHLILDYDIKNFSCNEHGERYIIYCNECNKDICDVCDHMEHKYTFLYKLGKKMDDKKNELRKKIDDLKSEKANKFDKLNNVIENLEFYYNFTNNIFNNFEKIHKNNYLLNSIDNINNYNEIIIKDINEILNEENIEKKNIIISNIYNKIIFHNEFILKYSLGRTGILRIFGEPFVNKNKNNFQIVINNKVYKLTSILNIKDIETGDYRNQILEEEYDEREKEREKGIMVVKEKIMNDAPIIDMKIKEKLEIKLLQIKNTTDISYMFSGCSNLLSIENSNWDIGNITHMSSIFGGCKSLISLPDISRWDTRNVIKMNNIFSQCRKLKSIPDISKWNTNNVTDMSFLFNQCKSLISLPDISKWNANNVTDMHYMFGECESLESLPDISKWNEYK